VPANWFLLTSRLKMNGKAATGGVTDFSEWTIDRVAAPLNFKN